MRCLQGKRGALPSSTIMLRQPMQRFTQMQASDIDIYRNEMRKTKNEIVRRLPPCLYVFLSSNELHPCLAREDFPILQQHSIQNWICLLYAFARCIHFNCH